MKLRVQTPTEIVVDEEAGKVSAEAEDGAFTLLPRHVDFATALVPGLLYFEGAEGEHFLAIDRGILVKVGDEVLVSTLNCVRGSALGELQRAVEESFREKGEHEERAQRAVQKIELDLVRRLIELDHAKRR